ncbi:hypothetical protein KAJ61_00505 [Candidatus Parcubacteria bacterium]|nr:hypothetical protein [Candidatus Parcubacteria bacterium]
MEQAEELKIREKSQEPVKEMALNDDIAHEKKQEESPKNKDITEKNILEGIKNSKKIHEEKQENIRTVADFINNLEECLLNTEDEEEKTKIAYHLVRIKGAFNKSGVKPDKFNIGATKDGSWSMYDKAGNSFKIDPNLIENSKVDQNLLGIVLEEAEEEKKGFSDIGFQQLAIKKLIGAREYHKDKRESALRVFPQWRKDKVLNLYNIKAPEKLADYFLEKEVEKRFRKNSKINSSQLGKYLRVIFKKGAPELYKKLQANGYRFSTRTKEIISSLEKNI